MFDDDGSVGRHKPVRRSAEERAAIVAETYEPGATVAEVARRHGMSPTRLSTWRTAAKGNASKPTVAFADVVVGVTPGPAVHDGIEIIAGAVTIRLPKSTPSKRVVDIARHLARP